MLSRIDDLRSLSVALGEFLASGETSDPTEYDPESLDCEACEPDGYLHDAVREVERHYGGKLPAPIARNAWRGLLKAVRDESMDSHDRQTVAHDHAGKLLTWAECELGGDERGIPSDYRTRAMSKQDAARYLGQPNKDSGVKWLNKCIADGTISCESLSSRAHVFDSRQFGPNVQAVILPK